MHQIYAVLVALTNAVFGFIEILLGLRFVFRLFAANSQAPFVDWLYDTTDVLVSPFRGIFVQPVIEGRFVLDLTTLIAMIVYGLVFSLILYLFNLLLVGSSRHVHVD